MALNIGSRIGPYEVVALLGVGGMGEVYRARDARLGRDVALKVLPEAFAEDAERLARFQREAQVLAALNHPHIAGIYGLEESNGVRALVLELVEGETLADRIARGPVPLNEALPIARQIAEALEAAHEQGIIHRDLKPANIKVTPDGVVKVLDFGLAKLAGPAEAGHYVRADATASPTITSPAMMTGVGTLLGTVAYMAPEQAKGRPADKRSDVWAFGCVVYEMATGLRAFAGEDVADTLAFVITREPDWAALPPDTPSSIHRLLRRCLIKDRRSRLPEIGTARLDIGEALQPALARDRAPEPAPVTHRKQFAWAVAIVAIIVLVGALAAAGMLYARREPIESLVYRSSILPPEGTVVVNPVVSPSDVEGLSVSPDGRYLAFVATTAGRRNLWLRRIDDASAQPLVNTDNAALPFWSPDSRVIGFFAEGKLKRVDIAGGTPMTICEAIDPVGGTWSTTGIILFGRAASPIQRVSASGGTPAAATSLDTKAGETGHWSPAFLPDGRHFLYTAGTIKVPAHYARGIYVAAVDSAETQLVLEDESNAQYASGHLLFMKGTTLMATPFDAATLRVGGSARPIADQVVLAGIPRFRGLFSASETGVLVLQSGVGSINSQLTWLDRAGKRLGTLGDAAEYADLELSPDGTQAAVSIMDPTRRTSDIWLYDVGRGVRTRFTSNAGDEMAPLWSPDGRRMAFISSPTQIFDVYVKDARGGGAERPLFQDQADKYPLSWSPDGRFMVVGRDNSGLRTDIDLWSLPLDGRGQPVPFFATPFAEGWSRFAPDGRWVSFASDDSGRYEIYVASFPPSDRKWLISSEGARYSRWRRDGREIFYLSSTNMLMAAEVDGTGGKIELGALKPLFALPPRPNPIGRYSGWQYDVSADGQRFLVEMPVSAATATPMTLIVNWPALVEGTR